jgi:hypothetical protein
MKANREAKKSGSPQSGSIPITSEPTIQVEPQGETSLSNDIPASATDESLTVQGRDTTGLPAHMIAEG